jgi:hypothetical protein
MIKEIHEGYSYTVDFTTARVRRNNSRGKAWPLVTQCVIYKENLIIGIGEVVKHAKDEDNPKIARLKAAKKAFSRTAIWRELRTKLWKQILTQQIV